MSHQAEISRVRVYLLVFLAACAIATAFISATIRPWGGSGEVAYRADFLDASRLAEGDLVRVSGVTVGRVQSVDATPQHRARVTFTAEEDLPMTTGSRAEIRYANMLGDRYLALSEGSGTKLAENAVLPISQTKPALDLDDLFNGFKPLFTALSPEDVNALAASIIATLQGEGTTVNELLKHTGELTSTLADRDEVIGRVVANLNTVLGTVNKRQVKLEELIIELTRFMSGLADDREAIGESIEHIDDMAQVTASLVHDARPTVREDVKQLGALASQLAEPGNLAALEDVVEITPKKLQKLARTGAYGSWFNFYLCDVRVDLDPDDAESGLDALFSQIASISVHDSSPRCDP